VLAQWPAFLARQGVDLSLSRLAFAADGPAAFALVAPRNDVGRWRLATMGALPAARGTGAAAALLDDVVARAAAAAVSAVELECFEQNERALRLYRGRGFASLHPLYGYRHQGHTSAPDGGGVEAVAIDDAFDWIDAFQREVKDLHFQVTPASLRASPVQLQAWRRGDAQLVFSCAGPDVLTIHSLLDPQPAQHDAQALAGALLHRHPGYAVNVPQLQRPDLGGEALERLGFQRLALNQLLLRRPA
jgi:hypothetical protein